MPFLLWLRGYEASPGSLPGAGRRAGDRGASGETVEAGVDHQGRAAIGGHYEEAARTQAWTVTYLHRLFRQVDLKAP